jgi:hypothetical protein
MSAALLEKADYRRFQQLSPPGHCGTVNAGSLMLITAEGCLGGRKMEDACEICEDSVADAIAEGGNPLVR